MAVLTAILTASPLTNSTIVAGASVWVSVLLAYSNTPESQKVNTYGAGSLSSNLPITLNTNTLAAVIGPSYSDVFYNRILVEPSTIDAGNLIGDQVRQITVFNGYFINKTLDSITVSNFGGLQITGPASPKTFTGLEEATYQLDIDSAGPAVIAGEISFNFSDTIDVRLVSVIGNRIVVLPYFALAPLIETDIWKTDIISSSGGVEQRIALRNAPRQQFSLDANIPNNEVSRVDNLFYGWRQRIWAVPIWSEAQQVTGVLQDDTSINVDTRFSDYRIGQLAIIWKNPRSFDAFEVSGKTDSTLVLDRGINANYNDAFVMPVRLCRMLGDPERDTNAYNGLISLNFESIENTQITPDVATQFNGYDVDFRHPLLQRRFLKDSYNRKINLIDYGTGVISIFDPWKYTRITRDYKLYLQGLEEIWNYRKWLHARRGKQVPFYSPSFEDNLRLVSNSGLLTTPVVIKNDENQSQAPERDVVAIQKTDGTWLLRNITSLVVTVTEEIEVNLDSPLNIDASEVSFISYMGLKRLASDQQKIKWLSNYVAEIQLSITEVEP